jgi:phage tail-like protein
MGNGRMQITLYGKWQDSLLHNLAVREERIVFDGQELPYGAFASGTLITPSIDSNEQNFCWENIFVDVQLPENSVIRVFCYASDDKKAAIAGQETDLDGFISKKGDAAGAKARIAATTELFRPAFSGATDGLLNARGRYLWLKLEFLVPDPQHFSLGRIRILYPNEKLLDYLPQIYRDHNENDAFFARFLNIFESIFFDIEDKVEGLPASLDYTSAKGDMLRYLANFVCIEENEAACLGDGGLRARIAGAGSGYAAIGTKPGIERFIERALNVKPVIVEYFRVRQMVREGFDRDLYRELFGENPYRFFILLPEDAFGHDRDGRGRDAGEFLRSLRKNIPAHTEAEIVLLKNSVVLDRHTYLGVNSTVGGYNSVSVDRHISISYDTMIGGNSDEEQ